MLLRFAVTNYKSFKEHAELSLVASSGASGSSAGVREVEMATASIRALSTAAIYGGNATGKTSFLQALQGLRHAVGYSQRRWGPDDGIVDVTRAPHAAAKDAPTEFEVDCVVNNVRHLYCLAVDDDRVLEESLHTWPNGRERKEFVRSGDSIVSRRGAKYVRDAERIVRPNSLLLSAAAQNNAEEILPLYRYLSRIQLASGLNEGARMAHAAASIREGAVTGRVEKLLREADLGIEAVEAEEVELSDEVYEVIRDLMKRTQGDTGESVEVSRKHLSLTFTHTNSDGGNFRIRAEEESAGTLAFLGLLIPLIETLDSGDLLLVDELDRSLHPALVETLLKTVLEIAGAQLIFSTHNPNALSMLRPDSVWLAEKVGGESSLKPLSDFEIRSGLNVERAYRKGRFGGVPDLPERLTFHSND